MEQNYRIAVIADGVVENVILGDEAFELPGKTLIRLSETCQDGFDTAAIVETERGCPGPGWAHDGEKFIHPDDTPKSKVDLKAYLGAHRRSHEVSGITWEGEQIGTSLEDQRTFRDIRMRKTEFPDEEVNYKTQSGNFITKSLADFSPIAEAVYQHVQKCAKTEASVFRSIEDGSVTTISQVTEVFDAGMI